MVRWRLVAGSLAGALAIHVAFLACGGAGGMSAVLDGGTRDAQAQDSGTGGGATMEGACVPVPADGGVTYYRATFDVPGFDPATSGDLRARACGFVCASPPCSLGGPALGVTDADCIEISGVWSRRGRVYVTCGVEGDHAQRARIWLR